MNVHSIISIFTSPLLSPLKWQGPILMNPPDICWHFSNAGASNTSRPLVYDSVSNDEDVTFSALHAFSASIINPVCVPRSNKGS